MYPGYSNMASSGFRFFFFAFVFFAFAIGLVSISAPRAFSQSDSAPLEKKFQQAIADTREMIKQCREISCRFFDGGLEDSSQWRGPWDKAAKALADQASITSKAAVDWFMACNNPDDDLLMIVSTVAYNHRIDRKYELAKRLLLRIEKFRPNDPVNKRDLALVCLKLNDFERALELVSSPSGRAAIEELENSVDKILFLSVGELAEKWKRESELRQKDATANLPRVKLELPGGDVIVELFEDQAPVAVANFLYLVEIGYYDETYFHRVIEDLVAHGGGFNRRVGKVPVGHTIEDEMMLPQSRHHFRGSLSMYNSGNPDSADGEFTISVSPLSHLDWNGTEEDRSRYTVFGRVIEGIETIDQLPATLTLDEKEEKEVPIDGVIPGLLTKATVIRKRDHDYEFRKFPVGRKSDQSSPSGN